MFNYRLATIPLLALFQFPHFWKRYFKILTLNVHSRYYVKQTINLKLLVSTSRRCSATLAFIWNSCFWPTGEYKSKIQPHFIFCFDLH